MMKRLLFLGLLVFSITKADSAAVVGNCIPRSYWQEFLSKHKVKSLEGLRMIMYHMIVRELDKLDKLLGFISYDKFCGGLRIPKPIQSHLATFVKNSEFVKLASNTLLLAYSFNISNKAVKLLGNNFSHSVWGEAGVFCMPTLVNVIRQLKNHLCS